MIITRTPFRISFCGGGSDLPAFYEKNGGCVLSTSIDKYMYLSVHPSFRKEDTILKYSKTEIRKNLWEIEHRYFKINGYSWSGDYQHCGYSGRDRTRVLFGLHRRAASLVT